MAKKDVDSKSEPIGGSPKPPPNNPRSMNELEAALAASLYLAGEELASDTSPELVVHALSDNEPCAPVVDEFSWLKSLVAQFRQALEEDPKRAELLRLLPQGLGDGDILRVLFGNLFPAQRNRRKELRDANGKKRLTETQIDILRETAKGRTPTQIAVARKCANSNVTNILDSIEQRLNTSSPQESVAVALSMGYLPLDIMDWINIKARCAARDYSPLDSLISYASLELTDDPLPWQDLASFGLLLMLASATAVWPQEFDRHKNAFDGSLYRLVLQPNGTAEAQQIVAPGLLRNPRGLAIAPTAARHKGFTPGNLFVAHRRPALAGMNWQEIMELTPGGEVVRTFCGSRSIGTNMTGNSGLAFARSGALLATSGDGLLRFYDGGSRVASLNSWCGTDVCPAAKGVIYHARYSGRGGSIGVYSEIGKLIREFSPLPPGIHFSGIRLGGMDNNNREWFAALRVDGAMKAMMLICDAESGETLRCWQVSGGASGAFALDARENRFYVPCHDPASIAVYTREGTLLNRIPLDAGVTPSVVTLAPDGALWLLGNTETPLPTDTISLSTTIA